MRTDKEYRIKHQMPKPPTVDLALYAAMKVKDPTPNLEWWWWTGQEWLPRYGEEMLGKDF